MQVAIFLASLAREGSKADRAGKTAFSGWMREAQKSFWIKQTSFTVWGNVLDRVIGHSNEPLLSPEGAWNPIEHTRWISGWREKALSVSSLPPVCVCSEPRRLGSSVSPQSRGQEGVSQVPQTLHLVCPRKDRWEAHPLLSTEVTKSPNTAWKTNEETFLYIIQGRRIIPFAFLKFSLLFQVPSGPGVSRWTGCIVRLLDPVRPSTRMCFSDSLHAGQHISQDLPPTACRRGWFSRL